jgi:hypothetical protein
MSDNGRKLIAWGLTEYKDRGGHTKTSWTKCGAAFDCRDGSINVELDSFPRSGRLQIREWNEERDGRRDQGRDDNRNDNRNDRGGSDRGYRR